MKINWIWRKFDELSGTEVYDLLAARQQVFMLEQQCLYLDTDRLDFATWHLLGRDDNDQLIAYARLFPPGIKCKEPSIGRVLVRKTARGLGLGRQLMKRCLEQCDALYPQTGVRISAQLYLQSFYESFGFCVVRGPYQEDSLPHIEMLRKS